MACEDHLRASVVNAHGLCSFGLGELCNDCDLLGVCGFSVSNKCSKWEAAVCEDCPQYQGEEVLARHKPVHNMEEMGSNHV